MANERHYDSEYFDWQKDMGKFGGIAELFKFEEHISPSDTILDFGCGGGYLLNNLNAARKIGVEINESAHATAIENGVEIHQSIDEVQDDSADVIISNHALEHVFNPLDILIVLKNKLKSGGKIIFVVPHDCSGDVWNENDINMHLYTWNEMTLGNLFKQAGFCDIKVESIRHQWPPKYLEIVHKKGWDKFNKEARKYALKHDNYQIKIIAGK